VLGGPVVYIVGEGSRGMKDRMKAWQLSHPAADISTAFVVLEPIMLHDRPALHRFINGVAITFKQTPPSLIVLDTLAQNFVGGDENSAQDMGVWLHGARMLQEKFGSTVLIVHHAARGSGRERGSTALRGASDTMIHMRRPSERVNSYKMACTKQKEGECFADTLFEIVPVAGTSSAVLKLAVRNDAVAELACFCDSRILFFSFKSFNAFVCAISKTKEMNTIISNKPGSIVTNQSVRCSILYSTGSSTPCNAKTPKPTIVKKLIVPQIIPAVRSTTSSANTGIEIIHG
jgi:hypothetical protein